MYSDLKRIIIGCDLGTWYTNMESPRRILLCGSSIYMLSLEANLRRLAGVETFWLDNASHNLAGSIVALNPDVVLIDVISDCFPEVVEILETHPGAQVITLDKTQHTFTILSGQSYPAETLDDLVQALGLSPHLPCESTSS